MTEFPKQLPTDQVTSLRGPTRLPYADHGPTGSVKEEGRAHSDTLDTAPAKHKTTWGQSKKGLQAPREGLFQRAKVWFGFGRRM